MSGPRQPAQAGNAEHEALRGANHGRIRSHVCPRCKKAFVRAEHLRRHVLAHDNEKPYSCPSCGTSYSRADVLHRHRKKCSQSQSQRANIVGSAPSSSSATQEPSCEAGRQESTQPSTRKSSMLPSGSLKHLDHAQPISASDDQASHGFSGQSSTAESMPFQPASLPDDLIVPPDLISQTLLQGATSIPTSEHVNDLWSTSTMQGTSNTEDRYLGAAASFSLSDDVFLEDSFLFNFTYNSSGLTIPSTPAPIEESTSAATIGLDDGGRSVTDKPSFGPSFGVRSKQALQIQPDELDLFLARLTAADSHGELDRFPRPSLSRTLRCIIAYFRHFDPHAPIIHYASFKISEANPALVLVILAIGAVHSFEMEFAHAAYEASCILLSKQETVSSDSSFSLGQVQATILCAQYGISTGDPTLFHRAERQLFLAQTLLCSGLHGIRQTRNSPNASSDWKTWIYSESCTRATCWMFVVAAMAFAFNPSALTIILPIPEPIACPEDETIWHALSEVEWRATRYAYGSAPSIDLWSLAKGVFHSETPAYYGQVSAFTLLALIGAYLCSICIRQRLSLDIYNPCDPDYVSRTERALATWEGLWRKHPRAEQSMTKLDDPLLNDCLALLGSAYYHLYIGEQLVTLKRIAENPDCGLRLPACMPQSQALKVIKYAANSWLVRAKIGVQYLSKAVGLDFGSQALSAVYETALILAWWIHLQGSKVESLATQSNDPDEEQTPATVVSRLFKDISSELKEQGMCYARMVDGPFDPLGFYAVLCKAWPWEYSSILEQRLEKFAKFLEEYNQ